MMKLHPLTLLFLPWVLVIAVQANEFSGAPATASDDPPLVSDLSVDQFTELVKTIVQQTLQECSVEGDMEGKAKLNLDVTGEVTASIVCKNDADVDEE